MTGFFLFWASFTCFTRIVEVEFNYSRVSRPLLIGISLRGLKSYVQLLLISIKTFSLAHEVL